MLSLNQSTAARSRIGSFQDDGVALSGELKVI
jgi:hypothetical protein